MYCRLYQKEKKKYWPPRLIILNSFQTRPPGLAVAGGRHHLRQHGPEGPAVRPQVGQGERRLVLRGRAEGHALGAERGGDGGGGAHGVAGGAGAVRSGMYILAYIRSIWYT